MKRVDDQRGVALGVVLGFVVLGVLCIFFAVLSAWAVGERATYKDKSDQLVAVAVEKNTAEVKAALEKEFAEKEKSPLETFVGPEEYGSLRLTHPKTWSIYTVVGNNTEPVDVYMDQGLVRSPDAQGVTYALRAQVVNQTYAAVLQQFTNSATAGDAKVSAYKLPKSPKIIGSRIEGKLDNDIKGVMVVLPLRDKAIKVWTESDKAKADFDNIVMQNLTFVP